MKKSPLKKIQKIHFKRPFIYACPQLKFGSLCIMINEKNEILGKYHLVFKLTLLARRTPTSVMKFTQTRILY